MVAEDYSIYEGVGMLHYSAFLLALISILWIWRRFRAIRIRGIHKICFLWILIMPIIMFLSHANKSSDYVMTILWPLLFEIGFIMTGVEGIEMKYIRNLFIFAFLVGLYFFLQAKLQVTRYDQTNTIYFPFLTSPFLLCCKNKKLQLVILIGVSLLGIWSYKRGLFIIVFFMWLFYFWQVIKRKKNILLIIGLAGVFLLGGIYTIKRIDDASGGILTARAEENEEDKFGRLDIYAVVLVMIDTSSADKLIVGHGHMGVRKNSPLELSAHNDVLEVIYDYGLIILLLYAALWLYVFKSMRYVVKTNSPYIMPYFCSLVIFVVMSMVSHLILYTSHFNYLVLYWGCMEGLKIREERMLGNKLV